MLMKSIHSTLMYLTLCSFCDNKECAAIVYIFIINDLNFIGLDVYILSNKTNYT
jgi:hypothetical protein